MLAQYLRIRNQYRKAPSFRLKTQLLRLAMGDTFFVRFGGDKGRQFPFNHYAALRVLMLMKLRHQRVNITTHISENFFGGFGESHPPQGQSTS